MFCILHISDLHRSPDEPADNDSLVAALLADRDRYLGETPNVPEPGAIIVSGDLIRGAEIGREHWQQAIRNQYEVAESFLDDLAKRFLDGDRSRLILIPGNHDVCWNTAFNSMEKISDANLPPDIRKELLAPDSPYRWSWKNRALYRIRDFDLYEGRLAAYWEFVDRFYSKTQLLRPIDRKRGYQLFELNDKRIVVAGFDSTIGNDCFANSGALSRGAVARCNLELRDLPHRYSLLIAVWHHSIQGPPMRDDYLDINQVHEMIGLGFQLGLHGHQHIAAAGTQYIHLNESQAMGIASAGSLCAGSKELPRGTNRQYNLIVVESDYRRARVHVREMVEGEQFSRKANGAFLEGYAELSWQPRTDAAGRPINAEKDNERLAVFSAEQFLRAGDSKKALAHLKGIRLASGSYARQLAIEAAIKNEGWSDLLIIIDPPQTIEEQVLFVSTLTQMQSFDRAAASLARYKEIDEGTRRALQEQIETKRLIIGL